MIMILGVRMRTDLLENNDAASTKPDIEIIEEKIR